jgi:hypothetical protein
MDSSANLFFHVIGYKFADLLIQINYGYIQRLYIFET